MSNTTRTLLTVMIALLMLPVGCGALFCSMCAASGETFSVSDRIGYLIAALVCIAILVGGIFAIARLAKKQQPNP
jgi:hypothetical protein